VVVMVVLVLVPVVVVMPFHAPMVTQYLRIC
jgi:hypothetical protein